MIHLLICTRTSAGMKTYEIAKELGTDHSTISIEIKFLTAQSQNYLNSIFKEKIKGIAILS
jgi:IS30 family transposase